MTGQNLVLGLVGFTPAVDGFLSSARSPEQRLQLLRRIREQRRVRREAPLQQHLAELRLSGDRGRPEAAHADEAAPFVEVEEQPAALDRTLDRAGPVLRVAGDLQRQL